MNHIVTIIPADQSIYVDGECLFFSYDAPDNVHAIQWVKSKGHIEFSDGQQNKPLSGEGEYKEFILPYVTLWEGQKNKIDSVTSLPTATFDTIALTQAPFIEEQQALLSDYLIAQIENDEAWQKTAQEEYMASIEDMKEATSKVVGE